MVTGSSFTISPGSGFAAASIELPPPPSIRKAPASFAPTATTAMMITSSILDFFFGAAFAGSVSDMRIPSWRVSVVLGRVGGCGAGLRAGRGRQQGALLRREARQHDD